ncbi:MAG: STAS domain-containing protein [Desulfohalobiaceae bacterium]
MFSYTISEELNEARLELAGELTIENSRDMSRAFQEAMAEKGRVRIDLSRAEKGDVSLLMIVGSALQLAGSKGGSLRVATPLPEFFTELANTAGCAFMLQDLQDQDS